MLSDEIIQRLINEFQPDEVFTVSLESKGKRKSIHFVGFHTLMIPATREPYIVVYLLLIGGRKAIAEEIYTAKPETHEIMQRKNVKYDGIFLRPETLAALRQDAADKQFDIIAVQQMCNVEANMLTILLKHHPDEYHRRILVALD